MTLNLQKRGASRKDSRGKFRPIIGFLGTSKIPSSTPEALSSYFRAQILKKYEENLRYMKDIWKNMKEYKGNMRKYEQRSRQEKGGT